MIVDLLQYGSMTDVQKRPEVGRSSFGSKLVHSFGLNDANLFEPILKYTFDQTGGVAEMILNSILITAVCGAQDLAERDSIQTMPTVEILRGLQEPGRRRLGSGGDRFMQHARDRF